MDERGVNLKVDAHDWQMFGVANSKTLTPNGKHTKVLSYLESEQAHG